MPQAVPSKEADASLAECRIKPVLVVLQRLPLHINKNWALPTGTREQLLKAAVGNSVPDGSGGLIVTSCPSGNPMTVSDLGPNGQLLWQEFAAGVNTGNGTITYLCNAPQIAGRGDGALIITEATNAGFPSVSMSGQMYPIPPSTVTNGFGTTIDVLCCVGPPMVKRHGVS
jgi:hypothetical protein